MKKVFLSLFALFLFSACAGVEDSIQKKLGVDAYYFLALQAADRGDESEALRLFKISRKKSNPLVAKRSAESLTLLGSVPERIEAAIFLAENYTDENSLVTACRELFQHGEFVKVINLTENLNLETAKNELVKLRLASLAQKKDGRFDAEFFKTRLFDGPGYIGFDGSASDQDAGRFFITGDIRQYLEGKIRSDSSEMDVSEDAVSEYITEKIIRLSKMNSLFGRVFDEDMEKLMLLDNGTVINNIRIDQ